MDSKKLADAIEKHGLSSGCAMVELWPYDSAVKTIITALRAEVVALWQPIATAPKYKEVLVWREDSGAFIAKVATPECVMSDKDAEAGNFPEDFEEWWSDAYGWQEGSEKPTHWQPLPSPPMNGER